MEKTKGNKNSMIVVHGDCQVILPKYIEEGREFQFGFADPPYHVGYKYDDKYDSEMDRVEPVWLTQKMMRLVDVFCVTPGIANMYDYPRPEWVIAWLKPGSTRRSAVLNGFNTWEPILVYVDAKLKKRVYQDSIYLPDCINHSEDSIEHPCPKPLKLLEWLIQEFTEEGDTVLDPFLGSGTTLVAAKRLKRNGIGIEIDEKYSMEATDRITRTAVPMFQTEIQPNRQMDLKFNLLEDKNGE